ncbi:MAG: alpha/beta hydrolase [Bacteroidia bacterium]|nr:alpha/beta hydrolase [Bacteroidia bacterium]
MKDSLFPTFISMNLSVKYLSILFRVAILFGIAAIPLPNFAQVDIEVKFKSSNDTIELAGTLTKPEGSISSIAVLLPVAGPTDRDLTLGIHKYYKTLADSLANEGIASLRFDDRGVGDSEGVFMDASLAHRTGDACAALEYLTKQFPEVTRRGFIGMSEGAGISVLASNQCKSTDFVVLLSMPVRKGVKEMKDQMSRLLAASPYPDSVKQRVTTEADKFLKLVSDSKPEQNRDSILAVLKGPYGPVILPAYQFVPRTPEGRTDFVLSNWYQSQLNYELSSALKVLNVPAMALYGELDKAIDYQSNADVLIKSSPYVKVEVLPGLNHLMQKANTGWAMEYAMLPTSFSADVISRIAEWISELPKE